MVTVKILNSHTLATLKAEAKKKNLRGFSALKKPALIELMMANKSKFRHIKMKLTKAQQAEVERKAKEEKVKYILRNGDLIAVQGYNDGMTVGLKPLDRDLIAGGKGSLVYQLDNQWFNNPGDYADDKVAANKHTLKIKMPKSWNPKYTVLAEGYREKKSPYREFVPVRGALEQDENGRRVKVNWDYLLKKNIVRESQILKI